jgi:hypothetical protein
MPENNNMGIPLIRYISCFLSVACLVLVIVILIKVNDKCKNNNENYDIEPSLNSSGNYSSSFSKGSVSDCNNALNNNSGVYYCDGQLIDPTDSDSFCTGPASFTVDIPNSNNNPLGSCSKPINSVQNSGQVLCSENVNYPIATNNCGANPNFGMQGLPSHVAIIGDM